MPSARFQTAEEFQAALIEFDLGGSSEAAALMMLRGQATSGVSLPGRTTPAPGTPAHTPANVESTPPAGMKSDVGVKLWDPAVLENVRKNLAVYVGPMAKVLVSRAARNSRNLESLYFALATEILSPADREKFLRSQPL